MDVKELKFSFTALYFSDLYPKLRSFMTGSYITIILHRSHLDLFSFPLRRSCQLESDGAVCRKRFFSKSSSLLTLSCIIIMMCVCVCVWVLPTGRSFLIVLDLRRISCHRFSPSEKLVCYTMYTAVFRVVMQRSWGGALRDDTKNGCVADYRRSNDRKCVCCSQATPLRTLLRTAT